jgi:hypothetical protein
VNGVLDLLAYRKRNVTPLPAPALASLFCFVGLLGIKPEFQKKNQKVLFADWAWLVWSGCCVCFVSLFQWNKVPFVEKKKKNLKEKRKERKGT